MEPTTLLSFLAVGVTFGLAGGLAPGPITALVIGQTLRYGRNEGVKVALAPVITDGPLIILVMTVLSSVRDITAVAGLISLVGSLVLMHLAWDTFQAGQRGMDGHTEEAGSIRKAVLTNLTNPHPYVFWFTIGGPMAVKSYDHSTWHLLFYLFGFAIAIVGSKVAMAFGIYVYRDALKGRAYRWVMAALALCLTGLAFQFAVDGWSEVSMAL